MKRLILFRHAKSDRPDGVRDIDRPLAARGRAAAPLMGRYLDQHQLWPDLALVSASTRTRETWALASAELSHPVPAEFDARLYHAAPETMLARIHAAPAAARTLVLVGHNPGCEALAAELAGFGDRYAAARMARGFPTAAIVVFDFDGGWGDVALRQGRLDRFVTPASAGAAFDDP